MKGGGVILPGQTIGVMGSGQLGRMLAMEARRMGYGVQTFSPEKDTPTGQIADREVVARYDDEEAVRDFARGVDVLTFEFENIPVKSVEWAGEHCVVRPSSRVLGVCQHRIREKEFLDGAGIPLAGFKAVGSGGDLAVAVAELGLPAILKTAAFGYDGKGQRKIEPGDSLVEVWAPFVGVGAVLEQVVRFEKEISVMVARGVNGETATYPVCENVHRNHILDVTLVPARIGVEVAERARRLAVEIAGKLELVGIMAVEMFLGRDGRILVNELAPRPHNSGHFSLDASVTSQFEQQLRAVCGLPLGSTESLRASAMVNLMGELWEGGEPDWAAVLGMAGVRLHLYGKKEPRLGRKMGHLVAFGGDVEEAEGLALRAREVLRRGEGR
jgi:5-(carboxyamino)imidazole ribonucleotide synthase